MKLTINKKVYRYWSFGLQRRVVDANVSKDHAASTFSPENGGSMFLRNVGMYLQGHTGPYSSQDRSWELQISANK
jgi:hypothetical protein